MILKYLDDRYSRQKAYMNKDIYLNHLTKQLERIFTNKKAVFIYQKHNGDVLDYLSYSEEPILYKTTINNKSDFISEILNILNINLDQDYFEESDISKIASAIWRYYDTALQDEECSFNLPFLGLFFNSKEILRSNFYNRVVRLGDLEDVQFLLGIFNAKLSINYQTQVMEHCKLDNNEFLEKERVKLIRE